MKWEGLNGERMGVAWEDDDYTRSEKISECECVILALDEFSGMVGLGVLEEC